MAFGRSIHATLALCAAFALSRASPGQTEFRLDDSGRWVEVPSAPLDQDAAIIAKARRDMAEERFADARDALDTWLKEHERTSHPLLAQAYLLRGDALTALGDEYTALYDYEAVCKQFSATEEYVKAVERELEIAVRYVNGYKRRILFIRFLGAEDAGEELLIRVQERLPSSRLAERAGIELADYYFRNGDMEMAAEAYRLFIENYPRSSYIATAMQRRIYATISRFRGPRYDNTPLIDASILTRKFASLYPAQAQSAGLDDALLARLDESAATGMLETARWYLRTGDPVSCRYVLKRLMDKYPRTAAASTALGMMTDHGWIEFPPSPIAPPGMAEEPPTPPPAAEAPSPAPTSAPAPAPSDAPPDRKRFLPARPLKPTPEPTPSSASPTP